MIRFLSGVLIIVLSGCTSSHFSTREPNGVTMYLDAPKASHVVFVSSQDNYKKQGIGQNTEGLWVAANLADREFRYFYIVDGRVHVPDCRYRENDEFGATNCIHQP
jgi:hypothetical protein